MLKQYFLIFAIGFAFSSFGYLYLDAQVIEEPITIIDTTKPTNEIKEQTEKEQIEEQERQKRESRYVINGSDYVDDYTFDFGGNCIKTSEGIIYCGTFNIKNNE